MTTARRVTTFDIAGVGLKRSASTPPHRQLYSSLRDAVLQRRMTAGTRLPSSRFLAAELGVATNRRHRDRSPIAGAGSAFENGKANVFVSVRTANICMRWLYVTERTFTTGSPLHDCQ